MAEELQVDLRMGRQRQQRPRLPGNLAQLGAVGPVVPAPPPGSQSVLVAGNIVSGLKQQTMGNQGKPVAQYLTEGKGRDGTDSALFGKPGQPVDPARFATGAQTDPHQFRFSVNPPRNASYFPLQPYIEALMARVERDLGRPLDWLATVHHDTTHPHAHVVIRGKDREEQPLYITTNYLSHGLRHRATQLATWLLGSETGREWTPGRMPEQLLSRDSARPEAYVPHEEDEFGAAEADWWSKPPSARAPISRVPDGDATPQTPLTRAQERLAAVTAELAQAPPSTSRAGRQVLQLEQLALTRRIDRLQARQTQHTSARGPHIDR